MGSPIKLIYILGTGHSGSTLLDLILGAHTRIQGVGELDMYEEYFTDSSIRPHERRRCSCSDQVSTCEFWVKVERDLVVRLGTSAFSLRTPQQNKFETLNAAVLQTILEISGKEYVCDSSKRRERLQRLLRSKLFEVHVVHLLRDGRAVAQSQRARTGVYSLRTLLQWARSNLYSFALFHRLKNYQLVRYEDLVADPAAVIAKMTDRIGLKFEPDQLSRLSDRRPHNIGGSRIRFQKGREIRGNVGYLQELTPMEWAAGTLLSFPALVFFGYSPLRSGMRRMTLASAAE